MALEPQHVFKEPSAPTVVWLQATPILIQHMPVFLSTQQPVPSLECQHAIMGSIVSLLSEYVVSSPGTSANVKPAQTHDAHAALARELRGRTMRVDMTTSFQYWPSGMRHPEYQRLRRECDRVLEMYKSPSLTSNSG